MSRIGKLPILIPANVTVTITGDSIDVVGTKGKLSVKIRPEIKVVLENNVLNVSVVKNSKEAPAYWGLTRALVNNMVEGVTKGFEKKLELVGVGYRVKQVGKNIELSVGFSNPVVVPAPEGIEFKVEDQTHMSVSGIDKQLVGLTAAKVRNVRKPEPYKGKGIKYIDEVVRRKAGKTGKA